MIAIYYIFAALLVWFSYRSYRGGIAYLRFFQKTAERAPSDLTSFATVIAPCRGLDPDLERNLQALLDQDHPAYEVIFVVDDETDPAAELIAKTIDQEKERREGRVPAKLVIAPKATDSSQKVANLREAVLHADQRSEAFVFVDSDVCVHADWLTSVVAPLAEDGVGAASAYRWFIARSGGLSTELRSAWNASIASALGPNRKSNFCWGGSMAMRRDVFERLAMREAWAGTLSDDFAVTRVVRAAGLDIVHVPRAVSASIEDCTFSEMLEFTTRQMKITRTYATPLWLMSFFGSALFTSVMIASVVIAVRGGPDQIATSAAWAVLLTVTVFSVLKSWLRLTAIRIVLPEHAAALARQAIFQHTLWVLTPPIFLWNSIAALVSRRLRWRGTTYELKSPSETVIIRG